MSLFECPSNAADTCDEFWKCFNTAVGILKSEILSLSTADSSSAKEGLQSAKQRLGKLQSYATESTKVLPPYDIRRSQEILEGVNTELKGIEQNIQPKKKFAFSSKSKAASATTKLTHESASSAPEEQKVERIDNDSILPPGSLVLSGLSNQTVFYSESEARNLVIGHENVNEDTRIGVYIKNTHNCTITLPMVLGSVRIENITHCSIYLGPVSTSVYIEQAEHCVLHFACHQLRIHNCLHTQLYIHPRSHPIIEDCKEMGFAPYILTYRGLSEQMEVAELANIDSHWDKVVDFRWHKSTPSPNWHVIALNERLPAPTIVLGGYADAECTPADGGEVSDLIVPNEIVADEEEDEL